MHDALIGYTGFVGSTLAAQRPFAGHYRSTNVDELAGQSFDTVYCAGAPGQKWIANAEPEADAQNLARLQRALGQVRCRRVVLLSTVDVFAEPIDVDEASAVPLEHLGGYGRNRLALETFVRDTFDKVTVVRLPGLVGPGLRKNALYDLLHGRRLQTLQPRACFQFYPTVRLWQDLQLALQHELDLVHLASEPVALGTLAREAFATELAEASEGDGPVAAPRYDVRSRHANLWGASGPYMVDAAGVKAAVLAYARDEPRDTPAPAPAPHLGAPNRAAVAS